jgi:hypothetical protein
MVEITQEQAFALFEHPSGITQGYQYSRLGSLAVLEVGVSNWRQTQLRLIFCGCIIRCRRLFSRSLP